MTLKECISAARVNVEFTNLHALATGIAWLEERAHPGRPEGCPVCGLIDHLFPDCHESYRDEWRNRWKGPAPWFDFFAALDERNRTEAMLWILVAARDNCGCDIYVGFGPVRPGSV